MKSFIKNIYSSFSYSFLKGKKRIPKIIAFVFIIQKHRHDSKDMFSYVDIMLFILFIPSTPQNIAKTSTDLRVECFLPK